MTDRRSHSFRSFCYGSLRPRRRLGRRDGDEHRIFLDWHEPRVLYLSLAILLMSGLDALLTLNILNAGGEELNGIMDWLIKTDPAWFVMAKLAITGLGVTLLVVAVNRHFFGVVRVIRIMEIICFGYVALMVWEISLLGYMFPSVLRAGLTSWFGPLG
ncbi:MAG: DUF5658 family protein [Gammaproteobacteria bacterium]|nr:DUF5658 family protein [Gammaproteobacteria bacterium]